MILKGQLHHSFFQIPSLNENKSITPEAPSRSSSAASPELRRQGKGTGDFWKLPGAFPGPEDSVQRWYSWHGHGCQGAAGRCSLRVQGPAPPGQHVQLLLCEPETIQAGTQIFSGGSGLRYKGLCLRSFCGSWK